MSAFQLLTLLPAAILAATAQDRDFEIGGVRIQVQEPPVSQGGAPRYRFVEPGMRPAEGWRRTSYGVHVWLPGFREPQPVDPLDPPDRGPRFVALFPESPRESRLVIVQYFTPPIPKYRELLAGAVVQDGQARQRPAGFEVVGPVSGNAELVHVRDQAALDWLVARIVPPQPDPDQTVEPFLRAVWVFRPEFRLRSDLQAEALIQPDPRPGPALYALQAIDASARTKGVVVEQILEVGGVVVHVASGRLVRASLRPDQLRALSARSEVRAIEAWAPPEGHGTAAGSAPTRLLDLVRADGGADALELAYVTGKDLQVHVIDTGFCPHEALPDETVSVELGAPNGYGGYGLDPGHGTQSVGVLAMHGGAGAPRGVLEGCQVQFSTTHAVVGGDRTLVTKERVAAGCLVESNSWGLKVTSSTYNVYARDLDELAYDNDILIVQSMGAAAPDDPNMLAWARNVVTVGAIDHDDDPDPSTHELFAPGLQGKASTSESPESIVKPDLCYWADQIETTWTPPDCSSASDNGHYLGASASTPQVAGYAGLVHALWRAGRIGPGAGAAHPAPATVRALLVHGASRYPVPEGTDDAGIPRHQQGWGRPNVETLMNEPPFILDEDPSFTLSAPGQEWTWSSEVGQGATSLKVTLAYADRAGEGDGGEVVNNLRLLVKAPDGSTYFGNYGLSASNWSTPATAHEDPYNTIENVFIPASELALQPEGKWWITVHAEALSLVGVDYDEVPFALVVTGLDDPVAVY